MANLYMGKPTHTPVIVPGRKRQPPVGLGLAMILGAALWVFLGLAVWGGWQIVKAILEG